MQYVEPQRFPLTPRPAKGVTAHPLSYRSLHIMSPEGRGCGGVYGGRGQTTGNIGLALLDGENKVEQLNIKCLKNEVEARQTSREMLNMVDGIT